MLLPLVISVAFYVIPTFLFVPALHVIFLIHIHFLVLYYFYIPCLPSLHMLFSSLSRFLSPCSSAILFIVISHSACYFRAPVISMSFVVIPAVFVVISTSLVIFASLIPVLFVVIPALSLRLSHFLRHSRVPCYFCFPCYFRAPVISMSFVVIPAVFVVISTSLVIFASLIPVLFVVIPALSLRLSHFLRHSRVGGNPEIKNPKHKIKKSKIFYSV